MQGEVDTRGDRRPVPFLRTQVVQQRRHRPGALAEVTAKFGEAGININYVYGSVQSPDSKCLFVFCPEDIDLAAKIFKA